MSNYTDITNKLYSMTYGHPPVQTPFGKKYIINADATASGYPNKNIEKIIQTRIMPYYSNTHSNAYSGRLMSHYIDQSKDIIRKSVNANKSDQVIFTGNGCSGAITHIIHAMNLRNQTPEKAVVFISNAEHHSNHLPWTHIPVTLVYIPLLENGLIDTNKLNEKLGQYKDYPTKIASFIATSNVTGVHQNVDQISQLIHKYGGLIFWDYAASAPYIPINMHKGDQQGYYFDAIFISTHKFFGGPGCAGLLVANQELFKNNVPFCPGGGTVRFVCPTFQTYTSNIEVKETGGTPNIIGSIKTGLVFDFKKRYQGFITEREKALVPYVQDQLSRIPNLKLLNPVQNLNRQPIFVFMIDKLHYNYIVVLLNDLFGIQTRGGISCCSLLAQSLLNIDQEGQRKIYQQIVSDNGVPPNYGWCRVTFHYSMPDFIINYILYAINFVAQNGMLFKKIYKYYPQKNNWFYCPKGCPWNDLTQHKLTADLDAKDDSIYLNEKILNRQIYEMENFVKKLKKID